MVILEHEENRLYVFRIKGHFTCCICPGVFHTCQALLFHLVQQSFACNKYMRLSAAWNEDQQNEDTTVALS